MMAANYPTKKALKESTGKPFRFTETSMFGAEYHGAGTYTVVGPAPHVRKYYAQVTVDSNDNVVRVK